MTENGENGEYTPSPRPHPRVRPEGAAYAERNRGTMERWFDYSDNANNYNSARPGERLRSDTARQIAQVRLIWRVALTCGVCVRVCVCVCVCVCERERERERQRQRQRALGSFDIV